MKKILLAIIALFTVNIYSQNSSGILPYLNVSTGLSPINLVYVQAGTNIWQKTDVSNLILPISQINNLQTNLDAKYPLIGNPSNFLTSITSGQVITALGFTPYNSTNPAGYIASFTETDPLFDTKFATKTTTNLTEGSNLYFTDARARAAISLTTTGQTGLSTYTSGVINIPNYTVTAGTGIGVSSNVITNTLPDQTVVLTGANNFGVSGTYPSFTLTQYIPADNIVTRTINSSTYTISATKIATVKYNIKITCTASIGSNSSGKVLFQYSTNGGSTWVDAGEVENSNTVSLAIVLNSTTTQSGFIVWNVPANALCRLVPTTTGTTTITWIRGQETY